MVTEIKKIMVLLLLLAAGVSGQGKYYSAGIYGNYAVPFGGLADRFKPAAGLSASFGGITSGSWYWSGEIEYTNFTEGNSDKFTILRNVDVNGEDVPFELKLNNLDVKFEMGGISANTEYTFIKSEVIESSFKFGFGIYRWFYSRGAVYDTLYADTSGAGDLVAAADLQVPAVSQTDWSGGFNTGLVLKIIILKPVVFYLNSDYKVIIGEIYPALDLGLENISAFQFINIKAGIRIRF